MATLYFNGAVDNDWDEIGNWWTSSAFTTQASALPTSSDSVVISAPIEAGGGTVVNLTCNDAFTNINFTVSGTATFNGGSVNYGTVYGNATFNDASSNDSGTVNGNVTFNDGSVNNGTVSGNATFNDGTINFGYVNESATFNGRSINQADVAGNLVIVGGPVQTGGRNASGQFYFTRAQLGINGSSILGVI